MRKIQNIISNFGNIIARQGNKLVVRIETSRSLRASSLQASASTLLSTVSELASWLRNAAWQSLYLTWSPSHVCVVPVVVKPTRRHLNIMCHRTAA
jgi:hypothetical protein